MTEVKPLFAELWLIVSIAIDEEQDFDKSTADTGINVKSNYSCRTCDPSNFNSKP